MPTSSYDVIVLGSDLPPLICAALLSSRGLRVLVLGQGAARRTYTIDGVEIDREPRALIGLGSPVVRRVFEELTLEQDLRRLGASDSVPFQLFLPKNRIDLVERADAWEAELEREFPSQRRHLVDIRRTLGEVRRELDVLVDQTLSWPPETFLEKQRFSWAASAQRYDRRGRGWSAWNQLPKEHGLRSAFDACLPHVSGLLAHQHSDMTRARLHGQLFWDVTTAVQGHAGLEHLLIERIRALGGDVRLGDRATSVSAAGRGRHAVVLARSDEELGCEHLVHGRPIDELGRLFEGSSGLVPLFERVGEPRARAYRCSVHFLVRRSGIPEALGPSSLFQSPTLGPWLFLTRPVEDDLVLLTANRLIPDHVVDTGSSPLRFLRKEASEALHSVAPFHDRHVVWVDSPHDGLPPVAPGRGADPRCSEPWSRGPRTMRALFEYPTRRALGVCALPTRLPLRGVTLCSEQVAPGLGLEGSFLAAASAARTVGSLSGNRDWLRRSRWARPSV